MASVQAQNGSLTRALCAPRQPSNVLRVAFLRHLLQDFRVRRLRLDTAWQQQYSATIPPDAMAANPSLAVAFHEDSLIMQYLEDLEVSDTCTVQGFALALQLIPLSLYSGSRASPQPCNTCCSVSSCCTRHNCQRVCGTRACTEPAAAVTAVAAANIIGFWERGRRWWRWRWRQHGVGLGTQSPGGSPATRQRTVPGPSSGPW